MDGFGGQHVAQPNVQSSLAPCMRIMRILGIENQPRSQGDQDRHAIFPFALPCLDENIRG